MSLISIGGKCTDENFTLKEYTKDYPNKCQAKLLESIGIGNNIDYKVIGELQGLNNQKLSVVTIWLQRKNDSNFYFITLKPYRN